MFNGGKEIDLDVGTLSPNVDHFSKYSTEMSEICVPDSNIFDDLAKGDKI